LNLRWNVIDNQAIVELGNHRSVMQLEKVNSWISEMLLEDMAFLDYLFHNYETHFEAHFQGYYLDKFEVHIFIFKFCLF